MYLQVYIDIYTPRTYIIMHVLVLYLYFDRNDLFYATCGTCT